MVTSVASTGAIEISVSQYSSRKRSIIRTGELHGRGSMAGLSSISYYPGRAHTADAEGLLIQGRGPRAERSEEYSALSQVGELTQVSSTSGPLAYWIVGV